VTNRQREQVVELLRCAADYDHWTGGIAGITQAVSYLEAARDVARLAWRCRGVVEFLTREKRYGIEAYREQLLEAAARVEEGSWP